jgi:hypothetical protein
VFIFEVLKELAPVHAVQRAGGPVQHLHQPQRFQAARLGQFFIQGFNEGNMQGPFGNVPIKFRFGAGLVFVPADPRGEHAVEEGLHQHRPKEMLALFGDELHT